ncbi:hypothetical protein [Epilithonimonas hominis]|uniref:HEXXH motif-containing protein n=1 Tax=Epilithonimonas hominis TaxID=420404 RepID=A0A3N0XAV5_9FLAO|nr:hypothetical protein [Epilithonimonas hominis]ROI14517.1 hypothetical protein EGH73_02805 [Epilithonimonas hominis]
MEINNFVIDYQKIVDELSQFSDTIKYLLYEQDSDVFENFDFDQEYLEPSLFYHFFRSKVSHNYNNYTQYIIDKYIGSSPVSYNIDVDCFSNAFVPQKGFVENLKTDKVTYNKGQLYLPNGDLLDIIPNKFISNSNIRLNSVVPYILHQYHPANFEHSILEIQKDIYQYLNKAYDNLSAYSPEFSKLLNAVTKEISVFDLPKTPSFASINYFGTSFININERKLNEVLFMDEIAHQSGHSIFTLLTRDRENYFLYPPDTSLKDFTGFNGEGRTLYGAFHSMFTLCTIINTLYAFLSKGNPQENMKVELYGRIGFYLDKLIYDIDTFSILKIFTSEGKQFYQMFAANMSDYSQLENGLFLKFNYDNQGYLFSAEGFMDSNKHILDEIYVF